MGGIAGLLLGGMLGYGLGLFLLPRTLGVNQEQILDSTFAVMGAVCKADGLVSCEEARVVEHFFGILGLSPEQRRAAQVAFNRGKSEGFDLYGEVVKMCGVVRHNRALLQLFLHIQLPAIAADGLVHDDELRVFQRIARGLGLSDADVERLLATLRSASGTCEAADSGLQDNYAKDLPGLWAESRAPPVCVHRTGRPAGRAHRLASLKRRKPVSGRVPSGCGPAALVPDRPTPAKTGLQGLLDWPRPGGIGRNSACWGLW